MSINLDERGVTRAVLDAAGDDTVTLKVPSTDYRIRLRLAAESPPISTSTGKRIRGTIEARALRMHPAGGGGRFIEPIDGEPRIVAGTVLSADAESGRVLIQTAVPMWLHAPEGQDFDVIQPGGLINCYVESGATFTPATE